MLKPCDLTFFVLSAHLYHDDGVCCCKWCECISNFEIPVWGKNVIVNLLNLSKNLIYNKKSFYASIYRIASDTSWTVQILRRIKCAWVQQNSTLFSSRFSSSWLSQLKHQQIAFIPFHYAVISMDEWMKWIWCKVNEGKLISEQKGSVSVKLHGAFKCSLSDLPFWRMKDCNKIQPLYLYVWGWTCS